MKVGEMTGVGQGEGGGRTERIMMCKFNTYMKFGSNFSFSFIPPISSFRYERYGGEEAGGVGVDNTYMTFSSIYFPFIP